MKKLISALFLCLVCSTNLIGQTELKFNAASALILVPNVGIEVQLSPTWGLQLDALGSFWDSVDGDPFHVNQTFIEARYYPTWGKLNSQKRNFFIGPHTGFGMYTLHRPGKEKNSYQSGRNWYLGLTVGYKMQLSNRFGLEAFLGAGHSEATYRYYNKDGQREEGLTPREDWRHFNASGELIPYRGGLMLVYLF